MNRAIVALAGLAMVSCAAPPLLKVGFVGGLSGPNADLGEAGRNGVMLALEAADRTGKRPVELLVRDDGNDPQQAAQAARSLIEEGVDIIIGPFNTAMTEAILEVARPVDLTVFSPTASSTTFSGKEDNFLRLCATTADNAASYAEFMVSRRGYRRISIAKDNQNHTFAQVWTEAFIHDVNQRGGSQVKDLWFNSQNPLNYGQLVQQLLEAGPDVILIVANAVDVARITQQLRRQNFQIPVVAVEWAATQQLIELGGAAVDGVETLQLFNRFGREPAFLSFVDAYRKRFSAEPSFSSILSYEIMSVVLQAEDRRTAGESLRHAILHYGPYPGLQQNFVLDRFGDTQRKGTFVRIVDGGFVEAP